MEEDSVSKIRVRMAPSPTGLLHIGTARAALFNWLFARRHGGTFVMRIEDTDKERSSAEFESDILKGLSWIGLDWDEGVMADGSEQGNFGPYRQSERLGLYKKYLEKLLAENKAYYCSCSEAELEEDRENQEAKGEPIRYSGKCKNAKNHSGVIRFAMPDKKVAFQDAIRGNVEFDLSLLGDIVIAKSLDEPLYNFAVVVDDYEMKITDVLRGEDHISNTPKQIAIAEALGITAPKFAHIPLILNTDKSKLSKRSNKVSMDEYVNAGYVPGAMMNFLALLGWHPSGDKEFFSTQDLINEFDLNRVQKSGAVFNLEKLNWLNREHIKNMSSEKLLGFLKNNLAGITAEETLIKKAIDLAKEKIVLLSEFPKDWRYLFEAPLGYEASLLLEKSGDAGNAKTVLEEVLARLNQEQEDFKTILEDISAKVGGRSSVYWPVRVSLSGQRNSAGPIEIFSVIGKTECANRIDYAIKKIT